MAEANVVTTASNVVWYTDKCEIVTGSTPVTYQVYATALRGQPAVGNIYSDPSEVPANTRQQIYVGVGNYLTIAGSDWTGLEIGGQTSAQAGVGGYGIPVSPTPPDQPTTPAYTGTNFYGDNTATFDTVAGGSYPCLANVTIAWTVNYASNNQPTGWYVSSITSSPTFTTIGIGDPAIDVFPTGDYTFSAPVIPPYPVTPWYVAVGSDYGNVQFNNSPGPYPALSNVTTGWTMYCSSAALVAVGTVVSTSNDGTYTTVITDSSTLFNTSIGYRFSPP